MTVPQAMPQQSPRPVATVQADPSTPGEQDVIGQLAAGSESFDRSQMLLMVLSGGAAVAVISFLGGRRSARTRRRTNRRAGEAGEV
ncbi:hypothetical protein AB0B45_21635 [Nonomuraea sp. NPDC049152]|uniref:hypothetical protein n=1 Tax=Nonomuraea sp. NPDC049152 TaxID=3154350 RepID=UPI003401C173